MEFWLERGFDLAMSEKALNENESTYNESTYTDAEARQILETLFLIEDFFRYGVRCEHKISLETSSSAIPSTWDRKAHLEALETQVSQCTACGLWQSRSQTVFGEGVLDPKVMVIGEGPGMEEDRQGLPFVGASGQLLDKMLAAIDLSRHNNCYIANIVKCRPPNNREPSPSECDACIGYLRAQIDILQPDFILCVGRIAAHSLLRLSDPISRLRGRSFDFQGIPVHVTFHPSALLRDTALKRPAWEDLKQFRSLMECRALTESRATKKVK